jgi:hypothetical protein
MSHRTSYGFKYLIHELFKSPSNMLKVISVFIICVVMTVQLFSSIPNDIKEYYKVQLPTSDEKYYNHVNEILILVQNYNKHESSTLRAYSFSVPKVVKILLDKDLYLNNKSVLNITSFSSSND